MNARRAMGLLVVVLSAAGCNQDGGPPAQSGTTDRQALGAKLDKLLADRLESARQAVSAYRAAYEAESVSLDASLAAMEALWKAELAVAKTPDERAAAHIEHIRYLAQVFDKVKALWEVGARGGEAEKYALSKCALETAEIALVDDCIAAGREYPVFEIYPTPVPAPPPQP